MGYREARQVKKASILTHVLPLIIYLRDMTWTIHKLYFSDGAWAALLWVECSLLLLSVDLNKLSQVIDIAADSNYGSKVMCSVVENTFTSIPQMARHLISYVKYIPLICHKNRVSVMTTAHFPSIFIFSFSFSQFTSIDKVQRISAPILFISGLNDSLVPSSMMSALHGQCKSSRKQLFQLSGGHMDTWNVNGWVAIVFYLNLFLFFFSPKTISKILLEFPLIGWIISLFRFFFLRIVFFCFWLNWFHQWVWFVSKELSRKILIR